MPQDENTFALSRVRLERAADCLREAENLLAAESFRGAASRAYYAAFHAMRAILALDGIDRKHHSGIISEFRRLYIKTGILPVEWSEVIESLSFYRTSSDYDDFFSISRAEAIEQVENAKRFLNEVTVYLQHKP